jgi:hypothetical protein
MAKNTFFAHWACEIRIRLILVTWRQVIRLATFIEGDGRLEKMSANVDQIAAGVLAGANHKVNAVGTFIASILPALPVTRRGRVNRDFRAVTRHYAVWFLTSAAQSMGHCRTGISLNLCCMTEQATIWAGGLPQLRMGRRWSACVATGLCVRREKADKKNKNQIELQ